MNRRARNICGLVFRKDYKNSSIRAKYTVTLLGGAKKEKCEKHRFEPSELQLEKIHIVKLE